MPDQDLYSGLIRLHVLHHASEGRIFGLGMIRELRRHGYRVGPGTLYPILHRMESKGYLASCAETPNGKLRRSYTITATGRRALRQARAKVRERFHEMFEERSPSRGRRNANHEDHGDGRSPDGRGFTTEARRPRRKKENERSANYAESETQSAGSSNLPECAICESIPSAFLRVFAPSR